ncbi:MAG: tetratricopeptide repeat protein [Candidatus Electrothrix sp. AR4]|nr:tetratricopeptide repeat protein [Candidatus Electrothrix sp. AR4]
MTEESTINMQEIYARAVAAHESGDAASAVELYSRILVRFPDADLVLYNKGLALFELDRFAEAATAFAEAAAIRKDDADIWFNLGLVLKQDCRYAEAVNAYEQALELQPDDRDILFNLANCCREGGDVEQAAGYYAQLLTHEPEHAAALNNFAYLCHRRHDYAQAEHLYQRLLKLRPDHSGALHMLAALSGRAEHTPENAYVRDLFDQYSDTFEQSLVEKLEYRVPELLFDCVRCAQADQTKKEGAAEERHYAHCLDLGCGTGLAGKIFRPVCAGLTGVDLSEKMIAQAAEKEVYDRLAADDVVRFLDRNEQQYDLFVAADLFTYLADLEPLLRAAFERIRPGGLFAFSTEHGTEQDWQVCATGRFVHHPKYVANVAERNGWCLILSEQADLRREGEAWVRGDLFVLTRPYSQSG